MFFGLLGLIQNQKWQQVYSFADYSGIRLEIISPEGIMDMLFGLVHQFGYRRGLSVLSRMGLLSLLSIPVAFCCLARSVRSVLDRNLQVPVGERLILHMLPCALAVVGMIFVFTTQNVDAERYSIPYAIWYIPLLTCMMTASSGRESDCCKWLPEWMTAPRLVSFALWGICFCNGLCNMNSFLHPDGFNQEYTGLSLKNPDYVSYIDDVQEVLVANHYDLGYCCFEEGNVLTELSDGQLPVVNLLKVDTSQGFVCYDWLTLESSRSLPAQKPFLLLTWDLDEWINTTDLGPLIEKAYSVNGYIIYDIPDLQAFREALT